MADDVIILASGPSVQSYNLRDLDQRGTLIALNGAALYVKADVAITMDRLVAELCVPIWKNQGVPSIWVRECTVKNFDPSGCKLFKHAGEGITYMTDTLGCLNGSNSGACALNLAYQLRPKRVFLLGYDMQRGDKPLNLPYWHPPYSWNTSGAAKDGKLFEWAQEFDKIGTQFKEKHIQVFNVNHRSRIEAFPIISYDAFKRMTDDP